MRVIAHLCHSLPREVAPLETRLPPRKTPGQARRGRDQGSHPVAARTSSPSTGTRRHDQPHRREAGLSIGSLYQYFPNKDAILVELVREHIQDGDRGDEAALPGTPDAVDLPATVRAVMAAMVGVHADDRRLHQVLFEESPRPARSWPSCTSSRTTPSRSRRSSSPPRARLGDRRGPAAPASSW